jgi:hypothetical protein
VITGVKAVAHETVTIASTDDSIHTGYDGELYWSAHPSVHPLWMCPACVDLS